MIFPYLALPTKGPVAPLGGAMVRYRPIIPVRVFGPRRRHLQQRRLPYSAASPPLLNPENRVQSPLPFQELAMDWREHIITDQAILCGKPTLKGTRLSVEFVLDLLAAGWDMPAIRVHYPNLTEERIRAVHAYVADILKKERFYLLAPTAKSA